MSDIYNDTCDHVYYLSHPCDSFGNREDNIKHSEEVQRNLNNNFFAGKNTVIINPICIASKGITWDYAMEISLHLLSACKNIIMCPNWEKSTGCVIEYKEAKKSGMNIHILKQNKDGDYFIEELKS